MDKNLEEAQVEQEFCKKCGGIDKVIVKQREIDWKEAMQRFLIAPDAWCICE